MNVLITGGTGFLGASLVDSLCQSDAIKKVYVLTRAGELESATDLFKDLGKVQLVHGDVTKTAVVFDQQKLEEIKKQVDTVVHASGHHNLEGDYQTCFTVNVLGTQNVLNLTYQLPQCKTFHYLSTFAVAGDHEGTLKEDELDVGQGHKTHFSKSKFDAEFMVRNFEFKNAVKRIYRLGTLVGARRDGKTPSIQGPHSFWNVLSKLTPKKILINSIKYLPMPYEKSSVVPLIHIEDAVKYLSEAVIYPKGVGRSICYHLLSESIPSVGEFLQDSFDEFGFKVNVVPLPKSRMNDMIMDKVGLSKELLSFLYSKCQYEKFNFTRDFQVTDQGYPLFKKKLFGELRENLITQ